MSLISGLAALAAASTLSIQATPAQERPETLERLMACRGIADNAARLACFDTAAGALDTAERQGDVVVIDRVGVAETRRQLFGFEMPTLPRLFGPEGAVALDSIDSTLQSASIVRRRSMGLPPGGRQRVAPDRFRARPLPESPRTACPRPQGRPGQLPADRGWQPGGPGAAAVAVTLRPLSPTVWVSPQLSPELMPALAASGVGRIISNRPDGEEPGQPSAAEMEAAARDAGLDVRLDPGVRTAGAGTGRGGGGSCWPTACRR